MPPRQWKLRIQDILDSIAAIQQHVRGLDNDLPPLVPLLRRLLEEEKLAIIGGFILSDGVRRSMVEPTWMY